MIIRITDCGSKEDLVRSLSFHEIISNETKTKVIEALLFLQSIIRSVDSRVSMIGTTIDTCEKRIKIILKRGNNTTPIFYSPVCMDRLCQCLMSVFYFQDGRSRNINVRRIDLYSNYLKEYDLGFVTLHEFNHALETLREKIQFYEQDGVAYYTSNVMMNKEKLQN